MTWFLDAWWSLVQTTGIWPALCVVLLVWLTVASSVVGAWCGVIALGQWWRYRAVRRERDRS